MYNSYGPTPLKTEDHESYIDDCSAIIVGKKASSTGEVLFGHNEDDFGNNVMVQHLVPRATWEKGTFLTFEDECARIPQVPETWAYQWSETRASWKASFSDTFINEWGVSIASDSCSNSREDRPELTNGGVGYALGHIVAQRARTAKEGVVIAAELLDHYGYSASGRAYQIVDKNEGWVVQAVHGKHYAAQRVPDDEVMFIPNWYTIHQVHLQDKANYLASKDIITYALNRGWYIPQEPGTYKDFSFARAYQDPQRKQDGNIVRHKNALRLILQKEPDDCRPFSVKPSRKLGVEDLKQILRTHYEGTEDDLSRGYAVNPHRTGRRTICTSTTLESFVIQFRDRPELTCIWRALLNPCTSPFVPWYLGIDIIPFGYGWIPPQRALANHFAVPSADLSYRPGRAWWAFQNVQDLADDSYGEVIGEIKKTRDGLEKRWLALQGEFEASVGEIIEKDVRRARGDLTDYTNSQAKLAWRTWRSLFHRLIDP